MSKEKEYKLIEPVQFGKELVESVTVTRKLKHLRGLSLRITSDSKGNGGMDLDFSTIIDLGAKMIGHPAALLDEMTEDDQDYILQEARDFLLSRLGTGQQA